MPTSQPEAILTFHLGPVQTFIESARTLRDLWAGSYLLSWLAFHAMKRVRNSLVFPSLEGNPLLRREQGESVPAVELLAPCLPNRFTAIVPAAEAPALANHCKDAFHAEWGQICETVHRLLSGLIRDKMPRQADGWDRLWRTQIEDFFEVRTAVLPWAEADGAVVRRLLGREPAPDLYMQRMELLAGLLESVRSVKHIPRYEVTGEVPQKCSLLGTYEQMGPPALDQSREFWKGVAEHVEYRGTKVRERERLCAVSLVKRFAWAAYFVDKLGLRPTELRFDDTATEAAREWLNATSLKPDSIRREHDDWSGQWLHWRSRSEDPKGEPVPQKVWGFIERTKKAQPEPVPRYYAILVMDGDHMGKWLRGDMGVAFNQELHCHLSQTLTRFALHDAGRVAEVKHPGTLIYAGGDDVLALMPTRTALACARDLERAFVDNWGKERSGRRLPNEKATASAGLAVVHHKEDLRFALKQARAAEKEAKHAGRNCLCVRVCRRSGEHTSAVLPWGLVPDLAQLVEQFVRGVSDRWTYRLRAVLPALAPPDDSVPLAVFQAETKRLLGRLEGDEKLRKDHGEAAAAFLGKYHDALTAREVDGKKVKSEAARAGFVTLCQSAAFLARGRDVR